MARERLAREDIWYPSGPTRRQAVAGAELIVTVNGSPFHAGKAHYRETMLATGDATTRIVLPSLPAPARLR